MKKKRLANEKEAEKWIGKRVRLEDGTFGTVESGSRGVFRVKVERPDDAKKEPEERSKKGKAGGICLRRAHEIKLVSAAPRPNVESSSAGDAAAGGTAAPDSTASEGQEQTAQPNATEKQGGQQEASQSGDDDDEDIFKQPSR